MSFHRFPANKNDQKVWMDILGFGGTEGALPKIFDICSNHFDETDLRVGPGGRRTPLPLSLLQQHNGIHSIASPAPLSSTEVSDSEEHAIASSSVKRIHSVVSPTLLSSTETAKDSDSDEHSVAGSSVKRKKTALEITCSDTITASETECQIIKCLNAEQSSGDSNIIGHQSGYRGKLSLLKVPVKRQKSVMDMNIQGFSSPRKARMYVQQSVGRLRVKVTTLNSFIQLLKEKSFLNENSEVTIKAALPGATRELFEKLLRGPKKQKYTPALRSFALTLSFYSPKAYNFVRRTFNKTLPHPTTISKLYQSIDGPPGWTEEALDVLKLKVIKAKDNGKEIVCNLTLDEMSQTSRMDCKKVLWLSRYWGLAIYYLRLKISGFS